MQNTGVILKIMVEYIVTCNPLPLNKLLGQKITRVSTTAKVQDSEPFIQVIDFWDRQFFLALPDCRTYYVSSPILSSLSAARRDS